MYERYRPHPTWLKVYLAHGLVDATYSILLTEHSFKGKEERHFIVTLTLLNHAYWVLGSLVGTGIENWMTVPEGLEFSMTAFFAATAVEQFLKNPDLKPLFISVAAMALAFLLFPHHFFLSSLAIAVIACLALPANKKELA